MKDWILPFLKERWLLLLLLAAFIIAKLPHLYAPFYWDESWSYAPGLQLMYKHGPSLMPNAIDTFYSRGHPLLFYATIAAWMRIFGPSHFSMHCFSLAVSVALLIAVFEVGKRLFSLRVAYSAVIFLGIQVAFFVQASMCLPEVMVALFTLLSLYFFTVRKYLLLYLSLTAVLFTKESGAVPALLLGIAASIQLLNRNLLLKQRLLTLLSIAAAGLSIAFFFLLQRKLNGWFLFPEHTGMITLDFEPFWGKFKYSLDFLFNIDKRYWLFRVLAFLALAGLFHKRKWWCAIPLLLTISAIGFLLNDKLNFVDTRLMLTLVVVLLLATLAGLLMALKAVPIGTAGVSFLTLSFMFLILYLAFTSINFYTNRYLLCLFPLMAILMSLFFDFLLAGWHIRHLWLLTPVCFFVTGVRAFQRDAGWGDTHLQAYNAMDVQQTLVRFLEHRNFYNRSIGVSSFQTNQHLTKPLTGMLAGRNTFSKVSWDINDSTEIAIFDNIEPDARYEAVKTDPTFERICRFQNHEIWAEVYKRRRK